MQINNLLLLTNPFPLFNINAYKAYDALLSKGSFHHKKGELMEMTQLEISESIRQAYADKSNQEVRRTARAYGFRGEPNAYASTEECLHYLTLIDNGTDCDEAAIIITGIVNNRRGKQPQPTEQTLFPMSTAIAPEAPRTTAETNDVQTAAAQLVKALMGQQSAPVDENMVRQIAKAELINILETEFKRLIASATIPQPVYHVYKTEKAEYKQPEDAIVPDYFDKVMDFVLGGDNVLLIGPAGCGKTHTAALIAKTLARPYSDLSLTMGMSESHLLGKFLPLGDHGRFEFLPAQFIAAYKNGWVFCLDEIDAADPNVLLAINAALANGHITLSENKEEPIIKRHKDFVCIACANTYCTGADRLYVGRNQLDAATLDRFLKVTASYNAPVEDTIIRPEVLSWARTRRAQFENAGLRRFISTRMLISFSNGLSRGSKYLSTPAHWDEQITEGWTRDEKTRIGL